MRVESLLTTIQAFGILAHSGVVILLPSNLQSTLNSLVEDKGVQVTSSGGDISVMGINRGKRSCGSFQIIPVASLDTTYLSLPSLRNDNDFISLGMVAVENDTEITLRILRDGSYEEETVTLRALQSLQLGMENREIAMSASKKIAVFNGRQVGASGTQGISVEQLLPATSWGYSFVLIGLSKYYLRVIAQDSSTTVDGMDVSAINSQGLLQDHVILKANKPIMVTQHFLKDNSSPSTSMVMVPAVERYQSSYSFLAPSEGRWDTTVGVIIHAGDSGSIIIDGNELVTPEWEDVTQGALHMRVTTLQVNSGYHKIWHSENGGFGIYVTSMKKSDGGQEGCTIAFTPGFCLEYQVCLHVCNSD